MVLHRDAEVIEAVARASARAAARVHLKMRRGLSSLASIAATAPFVGLLGTLIGIVDSFRMSDTSKGYIAAVLSLSLASTALGLLVAIFASCFYTYLTNRLESLDTDMQNASLDLLNRLVLLKSIPDPR